MRGVCKASQIFKGLDTANHGTYAYITHISKEVFGGEMQGKARHLQKKYADIISVQCSDDISS